MEIETECVILEDTNPSMNSRQAKRARRAKQAKSSGSSVSPCSRRVRRWAPLQTLLTPYVRNPLAFEFKNVKNPLQRKIIEFRQALTFFRGNYVVKSPLPADLVHSMSETQRSSHGSSELYPLTVLGVLPGRGSAKFANHSNGSSTGKHRLRTKVPFNGLFAKTEFYSVCTQRRDPPCSTPMISESDADAEESSEVDAEAKADDSVLLTPDMSLHPPQLPFILQPLSVDFPQGFGNEQETAQPLLSFLPPLTPSDYPEIPMTPQGLGDEDLSPSTPSSALPPSDWMFTNSSDPLLTGTSPADNMIYDLEQLLAMPL